MSAVALEDLSLMSAPADKRVNFLTTDEQRRWLNEQRVRDHLPASLRLRALIELVREDEDLAARVSAKASELERERLAIQT